MLGLFAIGVGFLYGPALAASLAVLLTMSAALTLLPALLSKVGNPDRPAADAGHEAIEGPRGRGPQLDPLEPLHPAPTLDRGDRLRRGC